MKYLFVVFIPHQINGGKKKQDYFIFVRFIAQVDLISTEKWNMNSDLTDSIACSIDMFSYS